MMQILGLIGITFILGIVGFIMWLVFKLSSIVLKFATIPVGVMILIYCIIQAGR